MEAGETHPLTSTYTHVFHKIQENMRIPTITEVIDFSEQFENSSMEIPEVIALAGEYCDGTDIDASVLAHEAMELFENCVDCQAWILPDGHDFPTCKSHKRH